MRNSRETDSMKRLLSIGAVCVATWAGTTVHAMPIGARTMLWNYVATQQAAGEPAPWPTDGAYNPLVANVYDGYILDADGALAGIIQVKAAKQTVKTVTDKQTKVKTVTTNVAVTATVTDVAGKKWSYKGNGSADGVVTGLVCTTKDVPVKSFGVTFGANGLSGEWGDFAVAGARNGMGTKDDAMMAALDTYYKKSWSVAFTNGQGVARLQLVVGAKGSTKISGTTADGFKISATVQGIMGEDAFFVPYLATLKNGKLSRPANLLLTLGKDGTVDVRTSNLGVLKAGGPTTDAIEVLSYSESASSKGGEAYAGAVVLNDLAYPAKFAAKGLPAGLKIDAATGAITGTPTKPGHYTAIITVTSGVNGKKKVETTVEFDIANYTDDLIPVADSYGAYCVGVMVNEPIAAALGCTVSGLPAGLKFAAKETKDKTFGIVPAGTVYGVPTKAGEYTVYFKKSVKENGKTVNHQASATFKVEELPAWAQGTFVGVLRQVDRDEGGNVIADEEGVHDWYDILATITIGANGKVSGKVQIPEGGTCSLAIPCISKVVDGCFEIDGECVGFDSRFRVGLTVGYHAFQDGSGARIGVMAVAMQEIQRKVGRAWVDMSEMTVATDDDAPLIQNVWANKNMLLPPDVNGVTKEVEVPDGYLCVLKFGKGGKVSTALYSPDNRKKALATGSATLSILDHVDSKWRCELCANFVIKKGTWGETGVFDVEISEDGSVSCSYRELKSVGSFSFDGL